MSSRTTAIAAAAAIVLFLALTARLPGVKRNSAIGIENTSPPPRPPDAGSTPVLVELFTSEGCSSCPPADALLSRLARTQPVRGADTIVLEEHVDYWDRLGWKDPFSSEAATARQGEYGEAFGGRQVYTPQMVVDGHAEFVGSSESEALRAISAAAKMPKPAVQLEWSSDGKLAVHIQPMTAATQDQAPQVFLAITENGLRSDVKRGENSGRALAHDGVVRQLSAVGKINAGSGEFSSTVSIHAAPEWNRANLRAVIFVQDPKSRRVLAASAIPFLK